jgi:regulator of protease activity HflC (stomatin/prohibitin superfamily)
MENVLNELGVLGSLLTSYLFWGVIFVLVTLKKGIKFVPQNRGYVIYRLGKYTRTLNSGMNFLVPYVEAIAADRNLKEQTIAIESQTAITKDNISLDIDGVLFIKVTDAAAATNAVTDYKLSVMQLAQTTMRNAIGSMELDDCFQQRDTINASILVAMEEATSAWGVKVTRYEIKDIVPPQSIKEDMEKQMSAEREKRSVILTAEGEKRSKVLTAEGEKEARILDAEASKKEQVLDAEGQKESQILQAAGEAEAIKLVADAKANSIKVIGEQAGTDNGEKAVQFELATNAIEAHKAIAKEGTIVLSDGETASNISNTVAQAVAISDNIRK